MFILCFVLTFVIFINTYTIINFLNPEIYYRYASEGEFTKDVYLSEDIEKNTNIFNDIKKIAEINSQDMQINTRQGLYRVLVVDHDVTKQVLEKNQKYKDHLEKNNLDLDGLLLFAENFSKLDENIIRAGFYLSFIILLMAYLLLFKYRKRIYLAGAALYIFSNLDLFSDGLFGNIMYYLIDKWLTYEEYTLYLNSLIPTLKEAILTFIIIDTMVQVYRDKKLSTRTYSIKHVYFSLEKIKNFIDLNTEKLIYMRPSRLSIDFSEIIKLHSKNAKDKQDMAINELVDYYFMHFEKNAKIKEIKTYSELRHVIQMLQIKIENSKLI